MHSVFLSILVSQHRDNNVPNRSKYVLLTTTVMLKLCDIHSQRYVLVSGSSRFANTSSNLIGVKEGILGSTGEK